MAEKNIKIAVDVDGVLSCFTTSFINVINSIWPLKIPPGYQPPNWNYTDKLSVNEMKIAWKRVLETKNIWVDEGPLPGVKGMKEMLHKFAEQDVSVYYVTHRPKTKGWSSLVQTNIWMEEYGLRKSNTSVIVVESSDVKAKVYEALGISYSIDDRPETVELCNMVKGHRAYLLDQSWNRDLPIEIADTIARVYSVTEFCGLVLEDIKHTR